MAQNIFYLSTVLCLVSLALTQVSDPSIIGIHDESMRILFYGGFGVLAGLAGMLVVISGVYVATTRFTDLSGGQRRLMLAIGLIFLVAVLIAGVSRLYPSL